MLSATRESLWLSEGGPSKRYEVRFSNVKMRMLIRCRACCASRAGGESVDVPRRSFIRRRENCFGVLREEAHVAARLAMLTSPDITVYLDA